MTGMPMPAQTAAAMAFLRARFLTALGGRLREMGETIDRLGDPQESTAAEDQLQRLFHSLAGIGGTYGFHEITFLAKAGEEACLTAQHRDPRARIALFRSIVTAIDAARMGTDALQEAA